MKLEALLLVALALVAYLGFANSLQIESHLLASPLGLSLGLTPFKVLVVLGAISVITWCVCIVASRSNRTLARGLGVVAALIAGHAARFSWQLNVGGVVANTLWVIVIGEVVTCALITRSKAADTSDRSATLSASTEIRDYSMSRSEWFVFLLLAASSAVLLSYRLLDVPGELNGFGSQAILAANRLINGEVAIRDLVLYREMTQEECGNSLPYVAWHAVFQLFSGGPSLAAARLACMIASWLSVLMMFRVARHAGGVSMGLLAMATYAVIPVTLHNAKNEGIFGFSALLILAACDLVLGFLRRPSVTRAILAGIAASLVGYGIANIKFYFLALLCTVGFVVVQRRQIKRYLGYGTVSLGCALLIILPQLLNLSEVKMRMRGRGEHIFGGVLPHLTLLDPAKPTLIQKVTEILKENAHYLFTGIFGPWSDALTSLPATLCVPMVVGLCLILSAPLTPSRLFVGLMWLGAYAAPFVSIPIGWSRILMLNIAQALVISIALVELLESIRSMRRLRSLGIALCCVTVLLSFYSALQPARSWFTQGHALSYARRAILQQPAGTVVFFTDRHEASGNFLRWNPPYIGRDSRAERQVVGIREEGVPAIISLVERLGIPAMIVSNEPPPAQITALSSWNHERVAESLWSMRHVGSAGVVNPVVQVLEAQRLGPTSPVIQENLAYTSPRLFLVRVTLQTPMTCKFENTSDLERVAILVRGRNSYSAPVSIGVDTGEIRAELIPHSSKGGSSSWWYLPSLPTGAHTITVEATSAEGALVDDIVVIGTPR